MGDKFADNHALCFNDTAAERKEKKMTVFGSYLDRNRKKPHCVKMSKKNKVQIEKNMGDIYLIYFVSESILCFYCKTKTLGQMPGGMLAQKKYSWSSLKKIQIEQEVAFCVIIFYFVSEKIIDRKAETERNINVF